MAMAPTGGPGDSPACCGALAELPGWRGCATRPRIPRDMDADLIRAHARSAAAHAVPASAGAIGLRRCARRDEPRLHRRRLSARGRRRCARRGRIWRCPPTSSSVFPARPMRTSPRRLALVEEVGFAQAFSFKYSPRPGTPATGLRRQVADPVKAERLRCCRSCWSSRPGRSTPPASAPRCRSCWSAPGATRASWSAAAPISRRCTCRRAASPRRPRAGRDHRMPSPQSGRRDRRGGAVEREVTRLSTLAPLPDLRGSSHRMHFDDNATCAVLFGQHHLNLARIEQKLPVSIVTRGNEVFIQGESEGEVRVAAAVLADLYGQLKRGGVVGRDEVDASLRMALDGPERGVRRRPGCRPHRAQARHRPLAQPGGLSARARGARPRVRAGPAGTGKTYLAVAMAVALLKQRRIDRIILSRPAVEAGRAAGLSAGRPQGEGRPLHAAALRRAAGHAAGGQAPAADRERTDRDRTAGLHARPHTEQCLCHPRRGAEHDALADEDVPHPPGRELAYGRSPAIRRRAICRPACLRAGDAVGS